MQNLPFPGQKYYLSGIVFIPDPTGAATLDVITVHSGIPVAVIFYRGKQNFCHLLPDGRPVTVKLNPPKGPVEKRLDTFRHHPAGVYTIKGSYPNFMTNTGERVWMDYDRSFRTYEITPDMMIERAAEYLKGRADELKLRKERRSFSLRTIRRKIRVVDDAYEWKLLKGIEVVASGRANLRRDAERDAIAAKSRLVNKWRYKT